MAEIPATTCACTRIHIGEASRPRTSDTAFVDRVAPHVDRAVAVGAPGIEIQPAPRVSRPRRALQAARGPSDNRGRHPRGPLGRLHASAERPGGPRVETGCGLALSASVETRFLPRPSRRSGSSLWPMPSWSARRCRADFQEEGGRGAATARGTRSRCGPCGLKFQAPPRLSRDVVSVAVCSMAWSSKP